MPSISEAARLRALRRRKGRREHGMFVAEGPRVVADLLASGVTVRQALYTAAAASDPAVAVVLEGLRAADVVPEETAPGDFREFAGTVTPQGILAVADIPGWSLEQVQVPRLIVLDAVQDPGNVGTLIRAAEALGAGGVACLPGTADAWNAKTVRSAAGSSFRLPVFEASLEAIVEWCRAKRASLAASAATGAVTRRGNAPAAAALVLGNEGAGVSDAVLEAADRLVGVPLLGGTDSLNVAIAGAILMDRMFGG